MRTPEDIRKEADTILLNEFGVKPERSELIPYDTPAWVAFKRECRTEEKKGTTTLGLYTPSTHKAHVWMAKPNWIATLYHEFHGHGLYFERSPIGHDYSKQFRLPDQTLDAHIAQWGFPGTYKENNEGFAVWMEAYLCKATGRQALWSSVRTSMTKEYCAAYERTCDLEKEIGVYGLLQQMGIGIPLDEKKASSIVHASAGGRRIDLALALPIRSENQPLRALIVSDARPHTKPLPWFAPRVISTEQFITETKQRASQLADELRESNFLFGDRYAWERARKRLIPS